MNVRLWPSPTVQPEHAIDGDYRTREFVDSAPMFARNADASAMVLHETAPSLRPARAVARVLGRNRSHCGRLTAGLALPLTGPRVGTPDDQHREQHVKDAQVVLPSLCRINMVDDVQ